MNQEQKDAAAERARERAAVRSKAREKVELAEIRKLWPLIKSEHRRIFDYIRKQVAGGKRTAGEVEFLRETRALHLAPYKRHLPKGESA